MKLMPRLPRRHLPVMLLLCLVSTLGAKPAGTLKINAWEFDRGNAQVSENPGLYGDYRDRHPELMLTGGDTLPWVVEYDIEFPVDATYRLRVRYASAGVRPLEVLLDNKTVGKCCFQKTVNSPPYLDRHPPVHVGLPERTWDRHGAQWEDSCTIKVTQGKHTLKLTRNGAPANPIEIHLESSEAFPKDWKPAARKVVLSRIPVRYRNVFLPPDAVNTETLRLAIEDTSKTFGSRYPKGRQYLQQLAELEKKQLEAAGETIDEVALKSLRREAMLDHPALKFDKLLFLKQEYVAASTYTLQRIQYQAAIRPRNICLLSPVSADGKVTQLVPEFTEGVFGRFDLSFDATRVVFSYAAKDSRYRIYEIDIDPQTGLRAPGDSFRQLTFDDAEEADTMKRYAGSHCGTGYHDLDPIYLPNGKIMFASTRSQRSVLCNPTTVTTLHVMDADGKNITCISQGQVNEISPCMLDDGRVIYMRWEYVDKGFGNVQSLWAIRPDGNGSDHVYKNNIICPGAMLHARSIPGSRKIVTTAAGHHGGLHGPIVLVDNRRHRRTADAMENLTPEIAYPGLYPMRGSIGAFRDPYPFSEKLFLVAHQPGDLEPKAKPKKKGRFGIYALDAWGNRAKLYGDPELSCIQPVPLRLRRMPTDIPPVTATAEEEERQQATMFMNDVYQGLQGIERGRVKYLRVMEAMNLGWHDTWRAGQQGDGGPHQQISMVSNGGDVATKFVHGIATVHEDGSAFFTVPANKNLYFQALDENYMELHRMRTFINLMPGEKRSCVGCHEARRKAPSLRSKALPQALGHGVEALHPQPGDTGPRAVHYPLDVQPILDRHCIGCHSGEAPKGDLVLSGEPEGQYFTRSYMALTDFDKETRKRYVSYLRTSNFGSSHVPLEPPLTFGSHRSKMVEQIRKGPCKGKLTKEEFIKIVTWIDANAPFYGTHRGKKNIKWKDDPDFRPMPMALKRGPVTRGQGPTQVME